MSITEALGIFLTYERFRTRNNIKPKPRRLIIRLSMTEVKGVYSVTHKTLRFLLEMISGS